MFCERAFLLFSFDYGFCFILIVLGFIYLFFVLYTLLYWVLCDLIVVCCSLGVLLLWWFAYFGFLYGCY